MEIRQTESKIVLRSDEIIIFFVIKENYVHGNFIR